MCGSDIQAVNCLLFFFGFQISPFPYDLVIKELERFPNAKLYWVQEEPKNMGAWSYVRERLSTAVGGGSRKIRYRGDNG